jgi:DNA-binding NarL/FixJ family response regulator
MTRTRVLIADDHAILRAGLRMLIDAQSDMKVVDEAADGDEAARKARTAQPEVVLLDITMPGPPLAANVEAIRRACPAAHVLVLTMHEDPAYLHAALAAGAAGYVVKKAAHQELLSAIRAVGSGRTFVDLPRPAPGTAPSSSSVRSEAPGKSVRALSERERQVLRLLALGHTNREIAGQLSLSVKSVETYRARLQIKLGLRGRAELYQFALASGLLEGEGKSPRD